MELVFKVILSLAFTVTWLIAMAWVWTHQVDPIATFKRVADRTVSGPEWIATRDPNKIYQDRLPVGEIAGPVTIADNEVTFTRLVNTTPLKVNEPLEYQRLRLQVVHIQASTGVMADPRGMLTAVLDGVRCKVIK